MNYVVQPVSSDVDVKSSINFRLTDMWFVFLRIGNEILTYYLAFIFRPLNPNIAADGRSYFHFKYPFLRLSGAAFSLSSINSYI
jgi:hypothetical protein